MVPASSSRLRECAVQPSIFRRHRDGPASVVVGVLRAHAPQLQEEVPASQSFARRGLDFGSCNRNHSRRTIAPQKKRQEDIMSIIRLIHIKIDPSETDAAERI